MSNEGQRRSGGLARSLAAGMAVLAFGGAVPAAGSEAPIDYQRSPATVVIAWQERIGEIGMDDHPTLKIHGDGRMIAHRPVYMRNAGDHVAFLAPEELDELVQSFVALGLPSLDLAQVQRERAAALKTRTTFAYASDPSLSSFELRLIGPPGPDGTAGEIVKRLSWSGLRDDAEQFPEVSGIQALARAEERLRQLMDRIEKATGR